MPTEAFWTGGAPPGTVRDQEELQRFLTKRKQEVLSELYRSGRLSQGELANRVHAKPTALSNILQKLDSFSPKLIKKDYEGKYCFYTLTEFGRKLMEKEPEAVQTQKSRLLQDREDEVLFHAGSGDPVRIRPHPPGGGEDCAGKADRRWTHPSRQDRGDGGEGAERSGDQDRKSVV